MIPHVDILLADDSPDEHFLFKQVAESIDKKIALRSVVNGKELIEFLTKPDVKLPDILFLDLNMPLKNGKESLTEIKRHEKLSAMPVVVYSTSDEKKDVDDTYALGATLYIKKPSDFFELEKTIARVIELFLNKGLKATRREKYIFSLSQ